MKENPIGGVFTTPDVWAKDEDINQFLPEGQKIWLPLGRDCIKKICDILKIKEILIPEFSCDFGLVRPLQEKNVNIIFYKLKDNLQIDFDDIRRKVTKKTDALMIIHYFGFSQNIDKIKDFCTDYNIKFIEDCAQSFLSTYKNQHLGSFGDLSFFSLRKSLPVSDGSLICVSNKRFSQIYSSSKVSRMTTFLLDKFDYKKIKETRRANFSYLLKRVKKFEPVFKSLPKGVCPLYFPIRLKNRDRVLWQLAKRKIYCAPHIPGILSVPCDQRYNTKNDMKFVAETLNDL